MTPAHTDSPLRRSEAGAFREGSHASTINDDEEERRQARRRTLLSSGSAGGDSALLEENETLKKCLEIYNGNKLSKDNAWSVSLIDTLSTLMDRHHKSLNNFGVAGSSLEASSKVYSLRVDSIHTDVMRMSAGLNAQKFSEKQVEDDDDEVATGGEGGNDPNDSAAGVEGGDKQQASKAKQKKQRKIVSTITKNKDTINARLDTVPLQDPVFGKLNSIVGSINSSNRLMNNILLTTECELRLKTTFPIWNSETLPECDFTDECVVNTEDEAGLAPCDRLFKVSRSDEMQIRPVHGGYVISDTPEPVDEDKDNNTLPRRMSFGSDGEHSPPGCEDGGDGGGGMTNLAPFHNTNELGMAFDMNAECEPMPILSEHIPIMDVNFEELDDLTTEERTAINNCRGLHKAPVLIEDLRPVDATSQLEYSYRPLDKISQFWAGPSHWKFKKTRVRPTMFSQREDGTLEGGNLNRRGRPTKRRAMEKKKSKQLTFGEFHDEVFIQLDDKFKSRRANIHKKWDQRKLKLPMDLRIDSNIFLSFTLAPGLTVHVKQDNRACTVSNAALVGGSLESNTLGGVGADEHFDDGGADDMHYDEPLGACGEDDNNLNASGINAESQQPGEGVDADGGNRDYLNETILEIATDYEGAPTQVTKVIVPFAKRAKVIDMKHLKRSCTVLLTKQLKQPAIEESMPTHPIAKKEKYEEGIASFHEIYEHLPEILPKQMGEALSTSIAFYSVLHLANEYDLRLIPEDDLKDFKIRKVTG